MDAGIGLLEQFAEDFTGDTSDSELHLLTDERATPDEQAQTKSSKVPFYVVPPAFTQQLTMIAAWTAWYGSQKEVSVVAERLMKVRSPALLGVHSSLKRAKFPAAVLLPMLGLEEFWSATRDAIPEDFSKIDVSSRLDANLIQLLGKSERDRINKLCYSAPATDVVEAVVGAWPIMQSLFEAGVFSRERAAALLVLAALDKMVGAGLSKLSQPDRHRRDMAAAIILRELPAGIAGLMMDGSTYLAGLLKSLVAARSTSKLLPDKVDPLRPLHLQINETQFADLVEHSNSASTRRSHKTNASIPRLLAHVESHALALQPTRNVLSIVYSQYVEGFARKEWQGLLEALSSHAQAMEVPFDQKLFAADLVGRDIVMPKSVGLEAVSLIRTLIVATQPKLIAADFIARADNQLSKVRELHVQISGLGQNLTAQAMGKLADLATTARTEILSNRSWFQGEVESYVPLIKAWQLFYEDWDRQLRKGAAQSANKSSTPLALVERFPTPLVTPVKPATPELADIQEQLETALTHCDHLERELSQARTELFNHRAFRESLASADAPTEMPQVDRALLRRVATRETLTPTDVLAFIQFVAGDRVVVLESAWKSARLAAAFPYSARMLDALNTMVFPYFESLKSGNPDAVARELLGGSYSAKESETVGVKPKLRVQREFMFDGQTRFFERHLKIGNGTGVDGMRVHFDIINGEKIVIAYAGPHLDCSTTS